MKKEFVLALNEVLEEKGLPKETILEALTSAMASAYRKSVSASNAQEIKAELDMEKGEFSILVEKEVVETVQNPLTEVTLQEAQQSKEDAQLDDLVMVDSTPDDFGRVFAQQARQVIRDRINKAEHATQYEHFGKLIGEITNGIVQAANARGLTIGLEKKAEGTMPRKEMIPHEHFRIHERIRALVAEVRETGRGPQIILSRTHRDFLRRLLENEVPEIFHGVVEIRSIAREPGYRAKVAVSAAQNGIDPVGSCVGMRGVRIQGIVRELHNEKIDVIEWNSDPVAFIAKAISPARVTGVYLHESLQGAKNALVVVPEDQLSLAIGREGQNARLAAKLTGWRIDIKSLPESISDWLFNLKNNKALAELVAEEAEAISKSEEILGRKAEGRVTSNNDYDFLKKFNDRLEQVISNKNRSKREAYRLKKEEILAEIPPAAFKMDLSESGLSAKIIEALLERKIETAGNLVLISKLDPQKVLDIPGIGPKSLEKIEAFGDRLPEIVPEEEVIEEKAEEETSPEPVDEGSAEEAPSPEGDVDKTGEAESETSLEIEKDEGTPEESTDAAAEMEPEEKEEKQKKKKIEKVKSFEELFKLDLEDIKPDEIDEEKLIGSASQKKGDKKKKSRHVEYDPDLDITIAKKKHKRSTDDWNEWEEE